MCPTQAPHLSVAQARWFTRWRSLLAIAVVALPATAALPASAFDALFGAWSGSGQIRYHDGSAEPVRCTAYYTGGGDRLRLAIRCRSTSNAIEIRGQLTARGDTIAGTWEERTFNAAGQASGRVAANRITLSVTGGGFSGSMSVSSSGGQQKVVISTEGIPMKNVTITMLKSG